MSKRYWRLLYEVKGGASLGLLLSIVTAFSGIALLAVSGWFISAAAIAGTLAATAHAFNFFTPGAMVRGLSISRTAGRYGERMLTHEATFQIISRLRTQIFNDLAKQKDIARLMNRHDSASRLMQDIKNVEGIYLHALVPALTAVITALAYLGVCLIFLPTLAISALPIILFSLVVIPIIYAKALITPEARLHELQSQVWSRTSTVFGSLRLLTLHGRLAIEGSKIRESATHAAEIEHTSLKTQTLINMLGQLLLAALQILSLGLALDAYLDQSLAGSLVFMLLLLTLGVCEILATTIPAIASLRLGQLALERLEQLSNTQAAERSSPEIRINYQLADICSIQIQEVGYRYANTSTPVLHGLTLRFEQHNWYWLKAPSGWGKTTLFGVLTAELTPTQGTIDFAGLRPGDLGYLPQRIQLLRASLRDNLLLHREASDADIWEALEQVQLALWARNLPDGLGTWVGNGEWQPSGGELKRIGLARLILQNPKAIILDEPFAGMDAQLQGKVLHQLRQIWQDRIVLIASHDLGCLSNSDQLLDLNKIQEGEVGTISLKN